MKSARIVALTAALLLPVTALSPTFAASGETVATSGSSAASSPTAAGITAETPTAKAKKNKKSKKANKKGRKKAPKVAKKAKKITIRVLPQIAQPGKKAASASSAKVAIPTEVKPKRRTAVTLQVKAGKKWKKVRSATTAKNGKHVFLAGLKRGGKAATYRVKVAKKSSRPASTQPWLTPSFSDNFSGSSLASAWSHRGTNFDQHMRACSRGDSRATQVSGGTVRLSVLKDPDTSPLCAAMRDGKSTGKFAHRLNGHIGTQGAYSFTYGVAAARVKFPKDAGQHAAFWLQTDNPDLTTRNPKINGAEIDVIESYGADQGGSKSLGLTTGVHRYVPVNGKTTIQVEGGWVKNSAQYLTGKKDSYHGGYHVFSVEWTPNHYIYRIDGQEYWRSTRDISGTAKFPVLSLLSSDYEISRLKGGDKKLPQHMHVDWLQVWETGGK